ncbi:HCLS1 protein, partial [Crypturellus undulatus]|nr:HCLS1 protein [Crypturellus undulatus]
QCAVGHEYVADVGKHSSQTDAAQGFGGKYGVQRDRADKSALGFEYKSEMEKHSSQKGKSMGTYYSKGFGGRYGVERDKVDKTAVGFDYKSQAEKHDSQKDYAKGFGGRYGVQKDRVDKSAAGFNEMTAPASSYEKTRPVEAASSSASNLRSRFENMAKLADEESRRLVEEEKMRRQARERQVIQQQVSHRHLPCPSGLQNRPFLRAAWVISYLVCPDNFLPKLPPHTCQVLALTAWLALHFSSSGMQQEEEMPPTLPPRPAGLGEELSKSPSQDQPIYSLSLDGGDYEELPESSDYCDSTSMGADYEELPEPLGKSSATYDHGEDAGEDY